MRFQVTRRRVELSFVSVPPAERIACAAGVSAVETDGGVLRCLVTGSMQPLLDAIRGYEVVGLDARIVASRAGSHRRRET